MRITSRKLGTCGSSANVGEDALHLFPLVAGGDLQKLQATVASIEEWITAMSKETCQGGMKADVVEIQQLTIREHNY